MTDQAAGSRSGYFADWVGASCHSPSRGARRDSPDEGSGTVALLDGLVREMVGGFEASAYIVKHSSDRLRSPEEAYYHKARVDLFGDTHAILGDVGRWRDREPGTSANLREGVQ